MARKSKEKQPTEENQNLRARLEELEETLSAIRSGEVDALIISDAQGEHVYTLKGANQPYRILVETMNEGTATVTPEGTVLYSNSRLAAMLKMPLEQLIGTSMRLHIAEADRPIFDDLLKKSLRTDCQGEVSLKAGEGTLPVLLSLSPVHSEGMDCAVMVITNLTEQKKAEESLLEALKEVKQLKDQLHEENLYLREEVNLIHSHTDIVGNSEAIRTVLKQIEQVAPTDSTVLIQGDTGTGKELLAHAIHNMSARKGRLMIKVNCAALPPTLIENELFGCEKGAFTGALSKQAGRFEIADASTIFLDEIDTLPLELQAKLLRVLESGEFDRLGSSRTVKVNIRIISATNRDLAGLVSGGGFREDLYYRLNVFQITVPPLRERREDILPLVWFFVQEFSKRMGKRIESIPQKGVEALQAYPWPGNVRELKNVIERAMIITTGPVLHADVPKIAEPKTDQFRTLEEAEKQHITETLDTTGWRVSGKDGAADILGINPKTLESRMQRLGIQRSKKNT
ncbi:MAG: sigma 54-interacting transcriptional regulator [Nitrospirae bacterium]|nr:sigma 54-interacting transcriptional regulator [Nitrospirota bacterium]